MAEAIGDSLPAAIGVALSPLAIVAVITMLATTHGRVNAAAFVFGWLAGLAVIGAVVLLLASAADASKSGEPADWVGWGKLALGLALLAFSASEWRSRPPDGTEVDTPKWMSDLETFTPTRAAAVGLGFTAANPKNLLFVLAGAATIAGTGISASHQVIAFAVFAVVATIGVGMPVVLYAIRGDRVRSLLGQLRAWMAQNGAAVLATLFLVFGWKLIGDAIRVLF